ncbi:MAG TPA: hypothetical protein ENH75_06425 [archaeon]|nr:hypothetical protein [archaeon]
MWIIIVVTFIVVCGVYCLGHWHGKKRCMIENGIIFGKEADEFIRKAIEAERKTGVFSLLDRNKRLERISDDEMKEIDKDVEKIYGNTLINVENKEDNFDILL